MELVKFTNGNSSELKPYNPMDAEYKGTSIEKFRLQETPEDVAKIITAFLIQANNLLGENQEMPAGKIPHIAKALTERVFSLSFETLSNIIYDGCAGAYGKIFGQLNLNTIGEWIETYKSDQRKEIRANAEAQRTQNNANAIDDMYSGWSSERIAQFKEAILSPNLIKPPKK